MRKEIDTSYRAVSDHELRVLPNPGATANLLKDEGTSKRDHDSSHQDYNTRFRDFLRHARLLIPASLIGVTSPWGKATEQRKVAAYQSRRMAGLNSLLHIVPLAGAVALLSLFWSKYWIGLDFNGATSLQFVAKLHELLMQASLIDVLLYIIRNQALDGYLPLGALAGAAQAPQLSYLWSLDFVSALTASKNAFNTWHKTVFAISTSALLFMTAVVGPSSAVLMIPRPGMSHTYNTTVRYLNVSEDALFPSYMDNTSKLNFTRYEEVGDSVQTYGRIDNDGRIWGKSLWLDDFQSPDSAQFYRVATLLRSPEEDSRIGGNWTIGTLPTMFSGRQLDRWCYRPGEDDPAYYSLQNSGVNWTLRTSQPVAMSACGPESRRTDNVSYVRLDGSRALLPNTTALYNESIRGAQNGTYPPQWVPMPDDPSSLLVLFVFDIEKTNTSSSTGNHSQSYVVQEYTICTVSSFWWTALTSYSISDLGRLVQTDWPGTKENLAHGTLRPITINTDGITTLSSTIFPEAVQGKPSMIVATFIAALSRVTAQVAHPYDWPSDGTINWDMIRGYDWEEIKGSSSYTKFEIDAMIHGFGFGAIDTSTRLSLAVIVAYCLITIVYIAFILATGHTSIAWNSATELIMLALQSKTPNNLGHVSVGLDSMNTFQRSVGIRVHTLEIADTGESEEKVELVFEHDGDNESRSLSKVERNRAY